MTEAVNFESAMARLEDIVHKMENDDIPLEDIVKLYEESIELHTYCKRILEDTQNKIQLLNESRTEGSK